jgi:histone-lysine N-methyltransferase ASH1L
MQPFQIIIIKPIFSPNFSDENGKLVSRFFNTLPSRKKHPNYYILIPDPIDFNTIERTVNTGTYISPGHFDRDILRLFQNNLRYFGRKSPEGSASLHLRKLYNTIKSEYLNSLSEVINEGLAVFLPPKKAETPKLAEDVIDCPCGQYKDEGVMIQCETCQIWQHEDCVHGPEDSEADYFCDKCSKSEAVLDIKIVPQPEYASAGETYYVSLMREDLQVRNGDTVYVLRAFKETASSEATTEAEKEDESFSQGGIMHKMMSPLKGPSVASASLTKGNYPTYKSVEDNNTSTEDMDIFRIERLWVNEDGEKFAFGHHYLRPHETFHEPSRKFFRNEVFRVPIYEVLPLDTIWKQCWVLDIPTFCKGRPFGAMEEHMYICEYRVDKTARLFNKISKPKFPACTKWFAFDTFDQRLKPSRTYTVSLEEKYSKDAKFEQSLSEARI